MGYISPTTHQTAFLFGPLVPWTAFIPWLLTPGSMPQGGARGKKTRTPLKSVFLLFLLWKQLMQIHVVGQTWLSLVTLTHRSSSEGQHDLYFTVQWFCLISWSTSYFGSMNQCEPTFDRKMNIGHSDLYFMVQWFCLILKTIWCMNIILWDYGSVWPDVWPRNKWKSMWPIFHGPVILPYVSKTIWLMSVILSNNETGWPNFDLKINIGQHDLYFMV